MPLILRGISKGLRNKNVWQMGFKMSPDTGLNSVRMGEMGFFVLRKNNE